MADKSACRDFRRTIEHRPIEVQKPNNDISVLLNMSISIIYVSAVPEL